MSAYVAQITLQANSQMGDAKRDLEEVDSLIGRVKATASGIGGAFALFGLASTGIRELKNDIEEAANVLGVTFNANLEQSRTAFSQFLGNTQLADAYLKDLMKLAADTPFEFPGLVRGAQRMMGLGVNARQVIPILKDIGNVVAAYGGSTRNIDLVNLALSQMISRSKVGAQEMNQLANQQIPAWQILSKAMGKTIGQVQEMARNGEIGAEVFIQAFRKFAADPAIANMMEKQSQTFLGRLSTIKDNIQIFAGTAFKPLFDTLGGMAGKIAEFTKTDEFGQWAARISGWTQVVMQVLGILVKGFGSALGAILSIVVSIGRLIYQALSYLNPFAKHSPSLVDQVTSGTALIAKSYADLAGNVTPSLDKVKAAMQALNSATAGGMQRIAVADDADLTKQLTLLGKNAPAAYFAAREAMKQLTAQAEAMDAQIKAGEKALRPYEAAVKSSESALRDAKDALQVATDALSPYEKAVTSATRAQERAQDALDAATAGLRPYQDAVEGAKDALDNQQSALDRATAGLRTYRDAVASAQDSLQSAQDALAAQQQAIQGYKDAVDTANDSLANAKDAYDSQLASLKAFRDAVSASKDALDDQQRALAQAERALRPYEQAVRAAQAAERQASQALADARVGLQPFADAVDAAKDRLDAANEAFQRAQDAASGYKDQLAAAQQALQNYINTPLEGTKKFSDALFNNEQAVAKLQFRLNNLKLNHGNAYQIRALETQIERLTTKGQNINLQKEMELGPLERQLQELNNTQKELTFEEAMKGAQDAQKQIEELKQKLEGANLQVALAAAAQKNAKGDVDKATAAYKAQQQALKPLEDALNAAQEATRRATDAMNNAKDALDPLRDSVQDAQDKVDEATQALADQESALKPYKDAVDAAQDSVDAASRAWRDQEKTLRPYKDAVDQAQQSVDTASRALRDQEKALQPLKDAVTTARDAYDDANRSLGDQERLLRPLKDALTDAKNAQDAATRALRDQRDTLDPYNQAVDLAQKNVDKANRALSDQKDALDLLKDSYSDLTDQMADYQKKLDEIASAASAAATAAEKKGKGGKNDIAGIGFGTEIPGIEGQDIGSAGLPDFKGIGDDIIKNAKEPLDALQKTIDSMTTPLQTVADRLKDIADRLAPMQEGWENGFGGAITDELDKFSTWVDKSWKEIEGYIQTAQDFVQGLDWDNWNAFVDEVKLGTDRTAESLKKGGENWGAFVAELKIWTDKAVPNWQGFEAEVKAGLENTSAAFTTASVDIKGKLEVVNDALKDWGEKGNTNLKAFIEQLKIGTDNTKIEIDKGVVNWNQFRDELKVGWDQASANWSAFGDQLEVGRKNISGYIDSGIANWNHFTGEVKKEWDAGAANWQAFGDQVEIGRKAVLGYIDSGVANWTQFTDEVKKAWDTGVTNWNTFIGDINTGITKLGSDISAFATDVATKATDIAKSLIAGLKWIIDEGPKQLNQWITDLFAAGIKAAKDFLGIKSPSTVFGSIGENLVLGIIQGIKNKWDELVKKVTDLAAALPEPIKKILGIKSPSEEFASLGEMMLKGLGQGVDENKEATLQILSDFANMILSNTTNTMAQSADAVTTGMGLMITAMLNQADPMRTAWDSLFGPDAGQEGTLLNRLWGHQDNSFFSVLVNYTHTKVGQWFDQVWVADLDLLATRLTDYLRLKAGEISSGGMEIGKSIDQGIADGITNNASIVNSAITTMLDNAMKAGQQAIEKGSPSRRAARELGLPIGQGVGMGLDQSAAGAQSSMRALMDTVVGAGTTGLGDLSQLAERFRGILVNFFGQDVAGISTEKLTAMLGQLAAPMPAVAPTPVQVAGATGVGGAPTTVTIHVHGLQGDIRSPHTWDGAVAAAISTSVQRERIRRHPNDPEFGARR